MYTTQSLHAFYMEKYDLSLSEKALLKPMSSGLDITPVQGRCGVFSPIGGVSLPISNKKAAKEFFLFFLF